MKSLYSLFFFFFFFKSQVFWGCGGWVFTGVWAFLWLQLSRGYSSCAVWASHSAASLVVEHMLYGVQAQSLQLPGSRAQAQQLWHRGIVVPTHVGPSQARDQTRFSCTGSGFFYH